MSVVDIRGVSKHFGDVVAVKRVDLEVNSGEFLVILGPSGCGKTTLMRMIAGLEQPTGGEIWIADKNVNGMPPRLRDIAMVFQSYALYPHMTVFGNISFPLKAKSSGKTKRLNRAEIAERVERAAEMVDIKRLLNRRPRQLSGGERQRVAIARALVTEPTVLLLDEPLSNLDAKLRASARDELKDFQQMLGITTIFVTHDQIEAMGLGDRIVVMSGGEIQQVGTPQEIYDNPNNIFVATFLGSPSMNLLPYDGYEMGFRPENFLPVSNFRDNEPIRKLTYHVKREEYLGSDRLLYGHVKGHSEDLLIMAKIPNNINTEVHVDSDHEFAITNANLRFFDKNSGQRIANPEAREASA